MTRRLLMILTIRLSLTHILLAAFLFLGVAQAENEPSVKSLVRERVTLSRAWQLSDNYAKGLTVQVDPFKALAWQYVYVTLLPHAYPGLELLLKPFKKKVSFQKHNEAAYAALLAYDQLISTVTASQQITDWQAAKNDSALLFANTFKADPRSNTVLTQTIQSLLNLKRYKKTITIGQDFVDRLDSMDKSMTTQEGLEKQKHYVIAGLSIAHAQRELYQFTLAEQSYEKVLLVLNESADSALYQNYYAATLDNYAASIYQQGVNQIAANNNTAAANHFMRVVSLAPASKIRVSAQRDAITLFIQTQQWQI